MLASTAADGDRKGRRKRRDGDAKQVLRPPPLSPLTVTASLSERPPIEAVGDEVHFTSDRPEQRRDSESGFRAITISRATSLHTRASLDLEILIVGDVFADVFLCSSSKRGLPASKATTINVTSSSSPALYQLPIRTFIFPLSSIFSQNGFSGQGVGEAATTTRSLPN